MRRERPRRFGEACHVRHLHQDWRGGGGGRPLSRPFYLGTRAEAPRVLRRSGLPCVTWSQGALRGAAIHPFPGARAARAPGAGKTAGRGGRLEPEFVQAASMGAGGRPRSRRLARVRRRCTESREMETPWSLGTGAERGGGCGGAKTFKTGLDGGRHAQRAGHGGGHAGSPCGLKHRRAEADGGGRAERQGLQVHRGARRAADGGTRPLP